MFILMAIGCDPIMFGSFFKMETEKISANLAEMARIMRLISEGRITPPNKTEWVGWADTLETYSVDILENLNLRKT